MGKPEDGNRVSRFAIEISHSELGEVHRNAILNSPIFWILCTEFLDFNPKSIGSRLSQRRDEGFNTQIEFTRRSAFTGE